MRIIKRISLLLFGFLSGLIGLVAIPVSIALMATSYSNIDDLSGRIFMAIWKFVICEVFLAFGVAASLLGLRCIFGPKDWIMRVIDYSWSKAVKFALILPFIGFGFVVIIKLIDFFVS